MPQARNKPYYRNSDIKRNNQHNLNAPFIDGEQINKMEVYLKW